MAFDGTTIAAVRKELSDSILGGRIYKIAQPEARYPISCNDGYYC